MDNRGSSLVEMSAVVSVVSFLVVALGFSYEGWQTRFSIEGTTRELCSDIMTARLMAIERRLKHYVVLEQYEYAIVEDTNDDDAAGPGDTTLPSFPKRVRHAISWNGTGNRIYMDMHGEISALRTIRFVSDADPDFDCIKVSMTRVAMGKHNGTECEPK